jgi:beta-galactosidase/beta-glucuronidase
MKLSLSFLASLTVILIPIAHATVIPSDPEHVVGLDGTWRFKLEQAGDVPKHGSIGGKAPAIVTPPHAEPFERLDYKEDESWHDLRVPSNWEMAGHSPATFNQPDNAIGLYRLWFDIPASWRGRVVKINFDGVQNGAEVFVNGQPVDVNESSWGRRNYHEGGWDAFQADLTPVAKFGEKNLLAIRVTKNTRSVDMDTGDYFFLGGVHRTVTLFSVPQTHVDDLTVRTHLLDQGRATVHVRLANSGTARVRASMQLEGLQAVEGEVAGTSQIELFQTAENARLWSAEHPNLYRLSIDLKDASGQSIEHIERRIGIREVAIQSGRLLVNRVPVKLTGMCRHEIYPTLGTALNEEIWRKELELMKAVNVNAVRTSHYPYGAKFYDLCDELGLYVADEMAACWTPTDTDELTPAFAQRARELVRRDKNHPCVIIWAIGNENRPGKNQIVAAEEIRRLDDSRPRLTSWHNEQARVEIEDAHYTPPAQIAAAERDPRRKTIPKSYLENPNIWEARNGADFGCLDRWAAVIDRTWREVWQDDHVIGSFLWEWQDRAVADQCKTKLYDFDPATGIQFVKVKGLTDGFRNPRPDYYHVKMAYAPIKLEPRFSVNGDTLTLHATNRYSFTDLSELKTTWRLLRAAGEVASGTTQLGLAPLTRGDPKLQLPAGAMADANTLRLDFDAADGRNVVTYQFRLKPEGDTAPPVDPNDLSNVTVPRLNLVAVTFPNNAIGWRTANRRPARLVNISIQRPRGAMTSTPIDEAALYATSLADVRAMDADVVFADDAQAKLAGHVRADFVAGRFSYRINWLGERTDVQELGWRFTLQHSMDHLSWHRKAYWSYYPPTHIGRPAGTATPDSADVPITKMTRPDTFDFVSTKYDCDWASLTDTDGHGLCVRFAPEARHHCRGGILPNGGGYELIVNTQCSPPRDLSSSVVPDYYLTLQKEAQVETSFTVAKLAVR